MPRSHHSAHALHSDSDDGDDRLDHAAIQAQVDKYQAFVNERLRSDLEQVLALRDRVMEQIAEYGKLASQVQTIKDTGLSELKTQVDLGSNFYVQAKVPDTTYVYVNVGFGFHVQLTQDETLAFVERKTKHLQKLADKYTSQASEIRAHMQIILSTIDELLAA
ncbi:Prefoldin subunit-domain-containing protein [Catenaria anguillulae PL171]|uniref:Prefoldin subunit-domain-containing protein n=1 Tax=Catenaria anguillulae PL171 TaxID=765915 RepID=A0A1Y2HLM7_9FUNG|nr:Prefoldin subunit-domain-containing protein [Catenaria anguillulae PL171]